MNSKVGRPKIAEDDVYNEKYAILLTKKEKKEMEEEAKKLGISVSKLLRKKYFKKGGKINEKNKA